MSSRDGVERIKLDNGEIRYRLRLVYRDPATGKKIVDTERTVEAANKLDALKQRKELLDELVSRKLGELRSGKRMRFAEAAAEWHATIKRKGTSNTWGSYKNRLCEAFGDRWLDSIHRSELQRYLVKLPYERSTVNGHKAVLMDLFRWAMNHGVPIANPSPIDGLKLPPKEKDPEAVLERLETADVEKRGMDHSELQRFMTAFEHDYPDMYVLVLVQLSIGARFAEVSALKRSDVDMQTGKLVIRRGQVLGVLGPPKNNKAREAALPRMTLGRLREHVILMDERKWNGHQEWLFPAAPIRMRKRGQNAEGGWFWHRNTVGLAIKATMKKVGIQTRTATHFARHTLNGLIRGHVADSVLFSVVGHSGHQVNSAYGDARVFDFANEVEKRLLREPGGASGGKTSEEES